jgi:Glycosyltransferase family 87
MAAHPRLRQLLWGGLLLLSALVIVAQGVRLLAAIKAGVATTTDFCLDYQTAQHWLRGARIYTPVTCWSRYSSTPVPLEYYAHPPFSLLVVLPFALLSSSAATWLWGILSLACLVLGFLLVCAELSLWRLRVVLPLLALFLLWDPTLGSTRAENIGGGVTCLLVALVWRALRRGQQGRAGLLAALVILLKPVPFLLLPLLLLRRQWRAAICAFLSLAAGILISWALMGPGAWLDYLGPARADEGFAVAVPSNLAIEGYIVRWGFGYHEFLHPGAVRAFIDLPPLIAGLSLEVVSLLGYLLAGAVLLSCGFRLWKRAPDQTWGESDDASFAAVLILTLLVFPSAWDWSLALVIIPLLWLGVKITQRGVYKTRWLYGAALILLAIPFGWLVPAFQLQAQTNLPWPTQLAGAMLTALPTIGLGFLLAALWPWLKTTVALLNGGEDMPKQGVGPLGAGHNKSERSLHRGPGGTILSVC